MSASLAVWWEDDAVHCRFEQIVRPVSQQVANINQNRQRLLSVTINSTSSIGKATAGINRHSSPLTPRRQNLQPGLPRQLEEQRDTSVVAVSSRTDIDAVLDVAGAGVVE